MVDREMLIPMVNVRFFGGGLNERDFEVEVVPRIGERIVLSYANNRESVKAHCFRVQDVLLNLDNAPGAQVGILVVEDDESKLWHQ
jgi:hypothetical protein